MGGRALLSATVLSVIAGLWVDAAGAHMAHAFPDRVLSAGSAPGHHAARVAATPTVTYFGEGGQPIQVQTTAYTAAEVQPLVDTLTSLPHGTEIDNLRLFVATEGQIDGICGTRARACYDPYAERAIVAGTPNPADATPQDFVLAHEYGHHLANHRDNFPWPALDWGAKRWATQAGVCAGVRAGQLHPGDQGHRYWSNPGEAFAQAYAEMALPSAEVGWFYDSRLTPDSAALNALRLDVTQPPRRAKRRHWRFGVGSQGPRTRSMTIATALDGRLRIAVPEGRGRAVKIALLSPSSPRVLDRSVDVKNREVLAFDVCGDRQLRVRVRVHRGEGAFVVRSLRP